LRVEYHQAKPAAPARGRRSLWLATAPVLKMPLPRLEVRERPASETTVYHQGELVSRDGAPPDGVGDVGGRGAKRPKVGGSIERYCDLDLDRLTIGPELKGHGNAGLKFARVTYRGQRLELQLTKGSGVEDAMRVPFGLAAGVRPRGDDSSASAPARPRVWCSEAGAAWCTCGMVSYRGQV